MTSKRSTSIFLKSVENIFNEKDEDEIENDEGDIKNDITTKVGPIHLNNEIMRNKISYNSRFFLFLELGKYNGIFILLF